MTYVQLVAACRKLSGSQASPPLCSCKPGECKYDKKSVSPAPQEQQQR